MDNIDNTDGAVVTSENTSGIDMPRYDVEYYVAIVENCPKRLEKLLQGYGWTIEQLFEEAEKTFTEDKFPGMRREVKAGALLWDIENKAKEKFEKKLSVMRKLLEKFLLPARITSIIEYLRKEINSL